MHSVDDVAEVGETLVRTWRKKCCHSHSTDVILKNEFFRVWRFEKLRIKESARMWNEQTLTVTAGEPCET